MTENNEELLQYLHTSNDVARYTIELIEQRKGQQDSKFRSGIAPLDRHMNPWLPGELIFVLAYTSHGKTSLLQAMTRNVVKQLQSRDIQDRVAIYASWETLVEELGLYDLASMTGIEGTQAWYGDYTAEQAVKLQQAAMKRAAMPLWVLGYSIRRKRLSRPMTIPNIGEALHIMEEEYGMRPAAIFVDYLQIIKPERAYPDKRIEILNIVDSLRDLARNTCAPVIVACQAGRQVLRREFKLPDIGDGAETARIEQDADKVLAMWYACKTEPVGTRLPVLNIEVDDNLMIMGIHKQRHGASGKVFPVYFDPARNIFGEWQEVS